MKTYIIGTTTLYGVKQRCIVAAFTWLKYKNIDILIVFWLIQISKLENVTRQHCCTHIEISKSVEEHIDLEQLLALEF